MNAIALLSTLTDLGIELSVEGGNLKCKPSKEPLTDDLKAAITVYKVDLIRHLSGDTRQDNWNEEVPTLTETLKEYRYADGRVVRLTKEQIQEIVDVFKLFYSWKQDI